MPRKKTALVKSREDKSLQNPAIRLENSREKVIEEGQEKKYQYLGGLAKWHGKQEKHLN